MPSATTPDLAAVRDFYRPELRGEMLFLTQPQERAVPWSDKPMFFGCGREAKDAAEAQSKGFETTGREFYRLVLGDEAFNELRKTKELDDRTREYFDQVKRSIAMLNRKDGWDGEKFDVEFQLSIWMNLTGSGQVDCGRLADGRWVAEWSVRTDIDDYNITDVYFDRRPTEQIVLTANLLFDAKCFLGRRRYDPSFQCCECGRTCEHWLEISAEDIAAKFEYFQQSCCGCTRVAPNGKPEPQATRNLAAGRVEISYDVDKPAERSQIGSAAVVPVEAPGTSRRAAGDFSPGCPLTAELVSVYFNH